MTLRFTTSIACSTGSFLAGQVIEVQRLSEELAAWHRAGILEIVRAPFEVPAAPAARLERAVKGRPAARSARAVAPHPNLADVEPIPALWPGETAILLAGGPSLTESDVQACKGRARVFAVNDAYRLAPWADVLYACDGQWWHWHKGAPTFEGAWRVSLHKDAARYGVRVLGNTGNEGIETDPRGLRTGKNGGYQAINLAYHFGIRRVILLGYDCQRTGGREHWFGDHPNRSRSPYHAFLEYFGRLAAAAPAFGLEIINATRETALECFRRESLEAVLERLEAPAGR